MQRFESSWTVGQDAVGERLDSFLSHNCPNYSRSLIAQWIKAGYVHVGEQPIQKPSLILKAEDCIHISAPLKARIDDQAEDLPLDVVYQDDEVLVIHKPAGLVVHPGAGIDSGTLLNGLLNYDAALERLPRAGIVHRLDKDTSGLMIVARTDRAYNSLVAQLKERTVRRAYYALVHGEVLGAQIIHTQMDRHPMHRTRMAVVPEGGKEAQTQIRSHAVLCRHFTLIEARLMTGRTHQIRVHMQHIGHPLVGDPVYGQGRRARGVSAQARSIVEAFPRQALHAYALAWLDPATGAAKSCKIPMADDMQILCDALSACEDGTQ